MWAGGSSEGASTQEIRGISALAIPLNIDQLVSTDNRLACSGWCCSAAGAPSARGSRLSAGSLTGLPRAQTCQEVVLPAEVELQRLVEFLSPEPVIGVLHCGLEGVSGPEADVLPQPLDREEGAVAPVVDVRRELLDEAAHAHRA